jgi:DNA polymerase-3 subunit delta
MRFNADQLDLHLRRGLQPLYAVFGDEPLLAMEAADRIRAAARAEGFAEREVLVAEGGFNWQNLISNSRSLSLFASRRILEIRISSGKPGAEGGRALEEYCASLPPETLTLVLLPKLDRQAQGAKWFKALEQAGAAVQVHPVERSSLPRWIGARLAAQNQRADAATLQFLADRVEGNLLAAHQEIRKLSLLFPPGDLTFEQVREAVANVSRYDVFDLTDAMLAGDAIRLARVLEGLRGEGEAPTLVLWAMAQEIRSLAKIGYAVESGVSLPQAMRAAGVWESRQPPVLRALKRAGLGRLKLALLRAADIDRMIKGLARGDVWDELLQLGLAVARPQ